jgi:8-oxo-dGTP diphosphatase
MREVLKVVAGCLIAEGRVLLAQRPFHKADGGLWELPGGKVEAGEGDAEALRRELKEELGIDVEVGPELGRVQLPLRDRDLLLVAYHVPIWRGRPTPLEAPALRWLAASELTLISCPAADRPLLTQVERLLTAQT